MWGMIIGAVVSYASAKSKEKSQKNSVKDDFENQKKLLEQQRNYELEDRKYRQDAANAWTKFANPSMIPNGQPVQQQMRPAPYSANQYAKNPFDGMNPYDQQ